MSGPQAPGAQTQSQLDEAERIRRLDADEGSINQQNLDQSFTSSGSSKFNFGPPSGAPAAPAAAPTPPASGDVPGQGGQDRVISESGGSAREVAQASTARRRADGAVEERESLLAGGQGFRGARRRLLG